MPLTLAFTLCRLKVVASRTLAVEAPGSVNTTEHTARYSCRQQALIHIWSDGQDSSKNFIQTYMACRDTGAATHTCAGGLSRIWLIAVLTAALKGTKCIDASLLTGMQPLRTLIYIYKHAYNHYFIHKNRNTYLLLVWLDADLKLFFTCLSKRNALFYCSGIFRLN